MAEMILTETCENGLGVLTIDNPKPLNASNVAMVAAIRKALEAWSTDDAVCAVLLRGSGGKAFCSGADVKGCREALVADPDTLVAKEQVYQEYNLLYEVVQYSKPTVALLEGVTMGFGLGLGCAAKFGVATEKTRLAMPENNIGLFPDVAFAHRATKMPAGVGRLMAFTGGHLIGAGDALDSGLATHHVKMEKLPGLLEALKALDLKSDAEAAVRQCIEGLAEKPEPGKLAANGALLEAFAGAKSLDDAYALLESAEPGSWGAELQAGMPKGAPFSQAVAWSLLEAAEADGGVPEPGRLAAALERDFATACRILHRPDFCEGVRCVLVDKGSTPAWQHSRSTVQGDEVKATVAPLPDGERRLGLPMP